MPRDTFRSKGFWTQTSHALRSWDARGWEELAGQLEGPAAIPLDLFSTRIMIPNICEFMQTRMTSPVCLHRSSFTWSVLPKFKSPFLVLRVSSSVSGPNWTSPRTRRQVLSTNRPQIQETEAGIYVHINLYPPCHHVDFPERRRGYFQILWVLFLFGRLKSAQHKLKGYLREDSWWLCLLWSVERKWGWRCHSFLCGETEEEFMSYLHLRWIYTYVQ